MHPVFASWASLQFIQETSIDMKFNIWHCHCENNSSHAESHSEECHWLYRIQQHDETCLTVMKPLMIHTREPPFTCAVCGKDFHIVTQERKENIKCTLCGKGNSHLKIHNDSFRGLWHLNAHIYPDGLSNVHLVHSCLVINCCAVWTVK